MKKIFLLTSFLSIVFTSTAQNYETCLKYFQENKYTEAVSGLKNIVASGGNTKDAALLLSMVQFDLRNYTDAFKSFEIFYKQSDDPYPYLYAELNNGLFDMREKDQQAFLEKVLKDPKATSELKILVIEKLRTVLTSAGDFTAVRALNDNTGIVNNWSVVGVFDNTSGSGFNKNFGFLEHPEADHVFTSKGGFDIKWFDIPGVKNDGWYDNEFYFYPENTIIAAQTFIQSDKDKEVLLKVGVSGSLKLWLNDYLVDSEYQERNTNGDVYTCKVKLQAGTNRILVQTGSSEITKNNFLVRLYDLNNNPLTDIIAQPRYKPYTKAAPYQVVKIPLFAEKYFEDKLAVTSGNDFINSLFLYYVYFANEHKEPCYELLKKLKKQYPVSSCISWMAARYAEIDNNQVLASKEKESIIAKDPECPVALLLRYSEAFEKGKWDDAQTLNERYIALYGASEKTEEKKLTLLSKKKETERLNQELDLAYSLYPLNKNIVEEKYFAVLNSTKDISKANEILIRYINSDFDPSFIRKLRDNYFKNGKIEEGKKWYKKVFDYSPIAVGWYRSYAESLYGIKDYAGAMEMLDKAISICPYSGYQYTLKAKLFEVLGKTDEEIEAYKLAIKYNPDYSISRKKLAELQGKKELSSLFKENDIKAICTEAQNDNSAPDNNVICLLDDKRLIVYEGDGAVLEQNEQLFLIKSSAGVEALKEVDIPYNSGSQRLLVDKAEIIKKDGSKVSAERNKNKCVFSSIEVGDVIHLSYKIENSYKGRLAQYFWQNIAFNAIYPEKLIRFSMIISADKKFKWEAVNTELDPTQQDLNGYKLYTWEKTNVPRVVLEPLMTYSSRAQLIISSIPDWKYVANWYSDLSYTKTVADPFVRDRVKELMAGNEKRSDLEKARIIYNFIQSNCHYSSVSFLQSGLVPQRASRTLTAKLGDCKDLASLFVAMAREAGLKANLVLVSTRGEDENEFRLPTIGFNHCIAQLHVNNKSYLLELTNNCLPFGSVPSSLLGANGLYIPANGVAVDSAALVKLGNNEGYSTIAYRSAQLAISDNKAVIQRNVVKTGAQSMYLRMYYRGLSEEEQVKKLKESVNKEFGKNVSITNVKIAGMDTLTDSIKFSYDIGIDNFCSTIVGMSVFKMPWTDLFSLSEALALDERKYPLDMWPLNDGKDNRETITVQIPAGKKLVEQPKDVILKNPFITYSIKYSVSGNKLVAVKNVQYLKEKIPTEEYAGLKVIAKKIEEAEKKEIVFK